MVADFSGYATKNGLKCSDGRTIQPGAFKHNDKAQVPLVWQHQHNEVSNILGHAILENREDGVYAYGYFNDTPHGESAKVLVKHGDINSLSIYANNLVQQSQNVMHGDIKEVSLVLSGANPGALIDNVNLAHGDGYEPAEDEAVIFTGLELAHEDGPTADKADEGDKTVQEVFDTLTDEQKTVVYAMVGAALEDSDEDDDADGADAAHGDSSNTDNIQHGQEGTPIMSNVFEQNGGVGTVQGADKRKHLTHSQITTIFQDAEKLGSIKESVLAHAVEYGIENIDFLFPDARTLSNAPEFIKRRTEWVAAVISGTNHSPFSRIKTQSADITHDEARALGYVKGNLKKEEWFGLAQRITTPTTIYKKQKLDRDDIIDITDLDVVAWIKAEMRVMLDEEIARAILIGDGREVEVNGEPNPDKINSSNIRPIAHDEDFYAHKVQVPANVWGDTLVELVLRNRKYYRGTGNPTMFTTEDVLTDLLLVKDRMGRRLYSTQQELETALRVSRIIPVEVMEGHTTEDGELLAVLVNLNDYTVGADKGGALAMFDDFDIDYNQYKYLMETRISGTLTKFKSALVITRASGTSVDPQVPTFVPATGVVTIPNQDGVVYTNAETGTVLAAGAQNALAQGATIYVEASPAEGYFFVPNTDSTWDYTRPAA